MMPLLTPTQSAATAADIARRAADELSGWYGEHVTVSHNAGEFRARFARETSAAACAAAQGLKTRPGNVVILTHKALNLINE